MSWFCWKVQLTQKDNSVAVAIPFQTVFSWVLLVAEPVFLCLHYIFFLEFKMIIKMTSKILLKSMPAQATQC